MQSLVYDTTRPSAVERGQRNLLVLWQNPYDRAYLVVGRLSYDGMEYTFGYTHSSDVAFEGGFRGLPGLRDTSQTHVSKSLFPVFAQRTLDPTRPDFAGYLDRLGLDEHATPFEQIIHSGGHRVADTVQLIEQPSLEAGHLASTFLVHGVSHVSERPFRFPNGSVVVTAAEHEQALVALKRGDALTVRHESGNEKNPAAIVVASGDGTPLGYVPDVFADGVLELVRNQTPVRLTVRAVNGPAAPSHLRVLVNFEAGPTHRNPFDRPDWDLRR